MVSKAFDKSKNTAKVLFFDALSLAFAMSFNRWMIGWMNAQDTLDKYDTDGHNRCHLRIWQHRPPHQETPQASYTERVEQTTGG